MRELAVLTDLPRQLVGEVPQHVVVGHRRAVGVIAPDKVLEDLRMMEGRRPPQFVLYEGTGQPASVVDEITDVRRRFQIGPRGLDRGRHVPQQLRGQRVVDIVGPEHVVGAVEHRAAVELIGPGAADHVEHESAGRGFGRRISRAEVRFFERVRIEIERRDAAAALRARDVHPIDVVPVLVARSMNRDAGLLERFGAAHVNLARHDARNDARDRPHIDAVGQRLENVLAEHRLLQRRRGVEQRRLARDDDALLQLPDGQRQVRARNCVGVDDDVALLDGPETLHLAANDIGAGNDANELIVAALVADRLPVSAERAPLRARERHRDARQHRSR